VEVFFMRMVWVGLLAGVLGVTGGSARAQTGVYAEFTGAKMSAANTPWSYGPTFGLYHDSGYGPIAAGFDIRAAFLSRGDTNGAGSSQTINTGLGGVRLAITPHVLPIKPYGEVLGGYGHLEAGQGASRTSGTHLAYEFLGGVDFTFFPRLDWRVVEFGYVGMTGIGGSFAPKQLSTGLVLRLP
jgi:hypothetical protein